MAKATGKIKTNQAAEARSAAAGRFFRFYWWRTPAAVGLVEDCS